VHDLADKIARAVTDADLEWLRNLQPRLAAVTAADVQAAARKYLNPERRVVVWSVPKKAEGAGAAPGDGKAKRLSARHRDEAAAGGAGAFSLKAARRVVLPNGLTVLVMENHRLPIVTAAAAVRHTRLLEPADKAGVAALTGELLVEGTTAHTGPQISELIEGVGGSLSTSSSGANLQVLSPDRTLGLSLLVECLTKPTFPKEAFDRGKTRTLTDIEDAETQPDTRAQRVYREAVYGEHPYGRSATGTVKTVSALTPADCAAFHKAAFVPDRTILVIVGDVEADKVIDEVAKLTADWKPGGAAEPKVAAPAKPEKFREIFVTMPEAAQLAFYMGHVGITRKDPDYYKLLVMDNVLGTGPGFTDRLSSRLRDREGLAYTVRATIASSADEQPGTFTCYIGLNPDDFARARAEFLEEIARIRTEKPTVQEVEDAKAYLLGSIAFRFDGNGAVAGQLLAAERLGLGLDFLDEYRKAVAAVTPDDVRAVAAKHLDPERMVLVAAGAIDDKGKPLGKK
jgi:zinc protease